MSAGGGISSRGSTKSARAGEDHFPFLGEPRSERDFSWGAGKKGEALSKDSYNFLIYWARPAVNSVLGLSLHEKKSKCGGSVRGGDETKES